MLNSENYFGTDICRKCHSKSRTLSRLDKTSISLISGLSDISEDSGGKVSPLLESSSYSLGLDFLVLDLGFFLEDEELQEHMSDLE